MGAQQHYDAIHELQAEEGVLTSANKDLKEQHDRLDRDNVSLKHDKDKWEGMADRLDLANKRLQQSNIEWKDEASRLHARLERLERSQARNCASWSRDVLELRAVSNVVAPDWEAGAEDEERDPNLVCALCGRSEPHPRTCSRCCRVRYCSNYCQKQDWLDHKQVCEKPELDRD